MQKIRGIMKWVVGPVALFIVYVAITQVVVVSYSLVNLQRAAALRAKPLVAGSGLSFEAEIRVPFRLTETGHRLLTKARNYAEWSQEKNLDHGMVVDRAPDGSVLHECDSLLFSSLRYVALQKLGLYELARPAWEAIQKSRDPEGGWWRHPLCNSKPLSRDMILGLLVAFSQNPPGTADAIDLTRGDLVRFDGFVSRGPFYVSFMSPGLRAAFDGIASSHGHAGSKLGLSFWTTELDALTTTGDYRSHLVALALWLEMEISRLAPHSKRSKSVVEPLGSVIDPLIPSRLRDLRLAWSARTLYTGDPENLFFRWLALQTSGGALTVEKRRAVALRLLEMDAFPDGRLPSDCDRRADYTWQRPSEQTRQKFSSCGVNFSGTDFLWMAALLLDDSPSGPSI